MTSGNGDQPVKPARPVRLIDIAARAGVAPMTVSRVVNQSGYVSEEVRERVQRVIAELNYHPNGLARSLKRQSTRVVGLLLPDIANPFSAELASSMQTALLDKSYSSFITTSERSNRREQVALRALFEHRVDGIIVATRETRAGNELLQGLVERGLPMVLVGRTFNHAQADRVTADHWRGGYDAVEHLIAQGHQRIAFVGVTLTNGAGLRRFQGYLDALREHSLPVRKNLIVGPEQADGPGYSTQADGYAAMKKLLALRQRPTAVFARNDYTAIGAMLAATDAGLRIPTDLAVAGFDNVPLSAYCAPPLTTVDQMTAEQGRRAAALLLERLSATPPRERREVILDCRLIVRQSTQPTQA
jgi:DNA-binding LacI/PurR family transcriptional regulator